MSRPRRRAATHPTGFVLIDKPVGPSSNKAVQTVRHSLGIGGRKGTKGGHAGTLDPFASGLLLVLLGHATKLMPDVVGHDKRYLVGVTFGASSDTDDSTGELIPSSAALPLRGAVENAARELAASTEQIPPAVSAIHIDGKRAHARVRAGETIVIPPRTVTFHAIDPVEWIFASDDRTMKVVLDVHCGSGTYMRALARDLGELVGCPAHCSSLRRTAVGDWTIDHAVILDAVTDADVLPVPELGLMPTFAIGDEHIDHILQGRAFVIGGREPDKLSLAVMADGSALAVLKREANGQLRTRSLLVDSPSVTGLPS